MAFSLELNHEGSNDTGRGAFGTNWEGQTFTTVGGFTLTKFGFNGYENGTIPADCKLYIYATAAGVPTGAAISTNTVPPADISGVQGWQEFELDDPVALSATTMYAFVFANPSGDASNRPIHYLDTTTPAYGGGTRVYSSNGGSSWSTDATDDVNFRLYSGADTNYQEIAASDSFSFTPTAALATAMDLVASDSFSFTASGIITFGPLSSAKVERASRYLVCFNNDSASYQG